MDQQITDESRNKPITHTDRTIHDEIRERARSMRQIPTLAEDMLWQRIRKKQVQGFRFRRQHAIARFIVDFYCFEASLVIEIDGGIHDEPGQAEYDEERQQYLESLDLRVLRFTNAQVINDGDTVVQNIGDWLTLQAASRRAQAGRD